MKPAWKPPRLAAEWLLPRPPTDSRHRGLSVNEVYAEFLEARILAHQKRVQAKLKELPRRCPECLRLVVWRTRNKRCNRCQHKRRKVP